MSVTLQFDEDASPRGEATPATTKPFAVQVTRLGDGPLVGGGGVVAPEPLLLCARVQADPDDFDQQSIRG